MKKTIDITPRWEGLFPLFSNWMDNGTREQKELVKSEFLKLCKIADRVRDLKIDLNKAEGK